MNTFGCCFWWFVFGALLGWLANWLLGRVIGKGRSATAVSPNAGTVPAHGDVDTVAARAAGFMVTGSDNLEVIEGIGPKIAHLLRSNGVTSFTKLASMNAESIHAILHGGGTHFNLADPRSWPEQAALAAANRWRELRELQDRLFSGHKT